MLTTGKEIATRTSSTTRSKLHHIFADAFRDAARILIVEYRRGEPDSAALPIVFTYRHALELILKGIIWNADEILSQRGKPPSGDNGNSRSSHSLSSLLPHVEYIQSEFNLKWTQEFATWDQSKTLILELDAIDPGSYVFRYPIDRKGKPSQSEHFRVNVLRFERLLDPIFDMLRDWAYALEDAQEAFQE